MSMAEDIAVGFGKFLAGATPELVKLWLASGRDAKAAIAVIKRANVLARADVDAALARKHGR